VDKPVNFFLKKKKKKSTWAIPKPNWQKNNAFLLDISTIQRPKDHRCRQTKSQIEYLRPHGSRGGETTNPHL
jgi:hypothetical protein